LFTSAGLEEEKPLSSESWWFWFPADFLLRFTSQNFGCSAVLLLADEVHFYMEFDFSS